MKFDAFTYRYPSRSGLVCLIVLGPDAFILPALLLTVLILLLLRPRLEVQP